ncbi:zincin-like metallopeptidase domain-containing protein [Bradyrhizobium sp. SSUT112]|uniref:zincin-like metallopeptidase domain-containing protein n=1 Tax=Bradyrhizobium sp. SSUT112 TaxID=3040604 RepID=UPI002449675B|nr:zincin-like metallopeptidase domain-containing protein [Bradyrhizobium sp. SSUT112]MDH2353331.1 zincin-like metallopeptidase domain-containing protein [Bradyrhizobium sp. SSUT112]
MMPNYSAFNSPNDFISALGHELIHATGHKDRLARRFNAKIFKENYATEALGSAFLCAHFGYSYIEAQSSAYLERWLKAL